MKFIPLESFESVNSLLQGVEAQGCLLTLRLEAFTCRHTKEERQLATSLAQYQSNNVHTPPITPSPAMRMEPPHGSDAYPPPLVLGASLETSYGGHVPPSTISPEDIDDRLIYLVAALNALYGEDGYDFSVLTERDFITHEEDTVRNEIQLMLQSLPARCGPAVHHFWGAIHEQVLDAAHGCEYYEFSCPACDPRATTSLFSHHYFLYNRRRKVMVSILEFGEGNCYRGDDGYSPRGLGAPLGGPHFSHLEDTYDSPLYTRSPDPVTEEEEYTGKNRDFYGY